MPFLSVSALSKSYRVGRETIQVLKSLDLEVEAGEMVAVVGASGVGKSTLLHVLGGLDAADAGQVRIGDTELDRPAGCRAGGVPQPRRWGSSSSSTTCCPSSRPSRTPRCRRASRACRSPRGERPPDTLLRRVGLGERLAHRPGMLSGGEQQRVAMARALVMSPAVLLADEPTGDLDEHTADALHDLLREVHRERRLTSLIATHNLRLAAACDRVLRLHDGRLHPA